MTEEKKMKMTDEDEDSSGLTLQEEKAILAELKEKVREAEIALSLIYAKCSQKLALLRQLSQEEIELTDNLALLVMIGASLPPRTPQ